MSVNYIHPFDKRREKLKNPLRYNPYYPQSRSVIKEATSFQHRHFADYSSFSSGQGNLFAVEDREDDSLEREIMEEIRAFDVDSSSPLSALQFLSELKKKLD